MILADEVSEIATRNGVPETQIWRDWVVSHLLHGLASTQREIDIVFYGGTALCRTWCPDLRFSEDIDLLITDFPGGSDLIQQRLTRLMRREFSDLVWGPPASANRTITTTATTENRSVKVQFVEPRIRDDRIPTTIAPVMLRYSDLPSTVDLTVPTAEGFAAMKLMAWHQRQAPRDLYDLAALADIDAITRMAIDLTDEVCGTRIGARILDQRLPPAVLDRWKFELAHQLGEPRSAEMCLRQVVEAARSADNAR